jgi:hypothetical protein
MVLSKTLQLFLALIADSRLINMAGASTFESTANLLLPVSEGLRVNQELL